VVGDGVGLGGDEGRVVRSGVIDGLGDGMGAVHATARATSNGAASQPCEPLTPTSWQGELETDRIPSQRILRGA